MKQPVHAVLMLQPDCNMTCNFCVTEETMGHFSFEAACGLLRDLKAKNYETSIFGGGEPFFWPHNLKALIQEAKSLGFITQVGTNATRLPVDFTDWDFIDRWVIPLDGVTDHTHNHMRFFQNRHRSIIVDTLQALKKAKRTVTISTVLTKINQSEIIQIAEYLRRLDCGENFIHAWHLYQFIPSGRGGSQNKEELLLPEQVYEDLVLQVKKMDLPFKIFKRKNMLLSETVEFFWVENNQIFSQSRGRPAQAYSAKRH